MLTTIPTTGKYSAASPRSKETSVDHFFHIFIPGMPENQALMAQLPAFIPMYNQMVFWVTAAWRSLKAKR